MTCIFIIKYISLSFRLYASNLIFIIIVLSSLSLLNFIINFLIQIIIEKTFLRDDVLGSRSSRLSFLPFRLQSTVYFQIGSGYWIENARWLSDTILKLKSDLFPQHIQNSVFQPFDNIAVVILILHVNQNFIRMFRKLFIWNCHRLYLVYVHYSLAFEMNAYILN